MKQGQSLLIVDDERSNLQKLRRTFFGDFQVYESYSGAEALELLRRQSMDVIITDQKMPGMSGVEMLSQSLRWSPNALRIILTGYTEVDYLMDAINQGQVHRYITKPWEPFALRQTVLQDLEHLELKRQNQVLQEQLRIAKEVQTHLFPQTIHRLSSLEYTGICRPAGVVGGDYYDFLLLSETQLCLAVGDISGKGISAALLMASLQALLRSHAPRQRDRLAEMFSDINRLLVSWTDGSKFATFFCGMYDDRNSSLTYVNAGHNPPLLFRKGSREPLYLHATGLVLGLFDDARYEEETVQLEPDDTLLIYTDGITEAENESGEEFGERRLETVTADHLHLSPTGLRDHLIAETAAFLNNRPPHDDLTLVVIRRTRH